MKKIFIICFIFVIGVIGFIYWNNRIVSTITLDINPSIEINLDRKNIVKSVVALNDDAKNIITNDLKGKNIDESIIELTNNVIKEGYVADGDIVVIISSTGNVDNEKVETLVEKSFGDKEVHANIITVDNITKEDKEFAKKNNISPAKAAYINSIVLENKNIDSNDLLDKSAEDLVETKKTGKYCIEGYFLEGDFCYKELSRKQANNGMVCPDGYYEYNGICYENVGFLEKDNYICTSEFVLNDNKCVRTISEDAIPTKYTCSKGEAMSRVEAGLTNADAGDANDIICVDYSNATHPVSPCELPASDPTERKLIGGKCYWHRAPVISSGCPGKIKVGGECWDDASNIYICAGYRDGKQYKSKSEYCEHSIKYINPTVTEYKCNEGFTLNKTKCERIESFDAPHERYCPNGYNLVDNDRCINTSKTASKEDGFVCSGENTRKKGDICITYDIIEAKQGG